MSGKPNTSWLETMTNKYGSREALTKHMQEVGSRGGSKPTTKPKGFAANRELAREAGRIGGQRSKRGKSKE